jgi:hypothetical protein
MPVLRSESLSQLDRLVQRHAVRNVGTVLELERGESQDRALDRVDLVDGAVEQRP